MAVSVTLVAVIAIGSYYVFGGKDNRQEAEQYWWQKYNEIVVISERFKIIDTEYSNRRIEGELIYPLIKPGVTAREVEALLGKPDLIYQSRRDAKNQIWSWNFNPDTSQGIAVIVSNNNIIIDKSIG